MTGADRPDISKDGRTTIVPPQRREAFKVVANATHASTVVVACSSVVEQEYRLGVAEAGGIVENVVFRHRGRGAA